MAAAGIVDEHVELHLAHAGVELVGERRCVYSNPSAAAPMTDRSAVQRRLGLDVVAVVRRQDLDLVDRDVGTPVAAAGAAAHGDRPAGSGQQAHERQGGEEDYGSGSAADHPGSLSGLITAAPARRSPTCHLPVILAFVMRSFFDKSQRGT